MKTSSAMVSTTVLETTSRGSILPQPISPTQSISPTVDPLYEDLINWATTRKRQFLRDRVKRNNQVKQQVKAEINTAELDTWMETWYTPPTLPPRIARQQAISTSTCNNVVMAVTEVEEVSEPQSWNLLNTQTLEPENSNTVFDVESDLIRPSKLSLNQLEVRTDKVNQLLESFLIETVVSVTRSYKLVESEQQLIELLQPLQRESLIAVSTETTGLDPLKDQIRLIQIAVANQPVIIIDLFKLVAGELNPLRNLFEGDAVKVLHNAKTDIKFLYQAGLTIGGTVFDTMLAAQLLDAGLPAYGYCLTDLVKVYLAEDLCKRQHQCDCGNSKLSTDQLASVAQEAGILLRLHEVMKLQLKQARLLETARLEFACLQAIAHMELKGMLLDLSQWNSLRDELESQRDQRANELRRQLQQALLKNHLPNAENPISLDLDSLNLNSQQQLLEILRQVGVPVENTNKLALIPLANKYPFVQALLDYRKAAKLVQTFARSLPKHIHPVTGRIHADYHQIGTATGRLSCCNPNMQQFPRDKIFRRCFVPTPGYCLIIGDYSQIELRVAAELSGDRRMIEAYRNDEDLHTLTAALIVGKLPDEVTPLERQAAKAVNFGLIYAMGAKGLAEYAYTSYGVQMSLEQAKTFRRRYFEVYQGIAHWHETVGRTLATQTRTIGEVGASLGNGRLRRWQNQPKLTELLNTPVQGTAADVTKAALANLSDGLEETGARLVGTVHDEILLEAPKRTAERTAQILRDVMEQAGQRYLRRVPIKATIAVTTSWAEK